MTQSHAVADDSGATSTTCPRNPLHPKTVTVFLDGGPSRKTRAAHAVALAQRWDAHLVGVHVVFSSEALRPWDCYAVGEKAIKQVLAHRERVHADDEAVASQVGEEFSGLCSRANVGFEFRRITWGRPVEES
jgi:hypothetical protein